ncbi:winged helix-turn-helix domain-containing protein [Umezawaea endophytica]|uniref:Winged helix-turn-helix domain-containing protein n=1 Tax=Umezawaea endophytica TaxID=1654476 RepID=A0A9X2VMZ3_9PSEU|nr:winged helix-turn-helix domain-containing protein [Umezawaea endophytica]
MFPTLAVDREPSPDLVALLGRTRAGVMQALTTPRSTSEIGRVLNLSTSSASEHATTLRNAGLISTTRRGNSVLHVLTSRGHALLGAG